MFYKEFTDKELLESHSTAMDYSGKAHKDLIYEINNRGGIDNLKETVDFQNIKPNELKRIAQLVTKFYNQKKSASEAKLEIDSHILSIDEKNQFIHSCYQSLEKNRKDVSINLRTIIGSIVGFLIASTIGIGLSYYSTISNGKIFYAIPTIIFIISSVIIRVLTGQSKNNWLVFMSSFLSAVFSFIIGLWSVS